MSAFIKNVELGKGRTKICLPIIAVSKEKILSEGAELKASVADIIEWRADFYEDVADIEKVLEVLDALTETLGDKPVLFTFRTKNEGGERAITVEQYKKMINSVIQQKKVGAVDVELFMGDGVLEEIVANAEKRGVTVVASNHDFGKTPDRAVISERLIEMKNKGAHVSKMAVMPKNEQDVINLLQATYDTKQKHPDMTIVTMSMGKMGVISRLGGGIFGSAMTFGAKSRELASAPGQVEASLLKDILEVVEG